MTTQMPRSPRRLGTVLILFAALSAALAAAPEAKHGAGHKKAPVVVDAKAAEIVTVKKADEWETGGITVMTQAVAINETGPKATVARFGEIYAFSPSFIAPWVAPSSSTISSTAIMWGRRP